MIYKDAETMRLTRNCLNLATSSNTISVGFLKSQVTYANNNSALIDLCTGIVTPKSLYRRHPKPNKRNLDPKSYVYTPVYFDPVDPDSSESKYCQGRVHILNTCLSLYHRDLFAAALQRAAIEADCALSEATVEIHHIDKNRKNNAIQNLLSVTPKEHDKIHAALNHGASTYESLVAGLGVGLVDSIFGSNYFDRGDGGGVFTASIAGVPYIQHILNQLSAANLPADCKCLQAIDLHNRRISITIEGMTVYEMLSELYTKRAAKIEASYKLETAI